jgi:hypothetical protein
VLTVDEPSARPVAWVGPGRRTLVIASGQDLTTLQTVVLAPDGRVGGGSAAPYVPPGPGVSGRAFPLTSGGFAWAWPASTDATTWHVADVDADLTVTLRPGTVTGEPLLVSRDYVVSAPSASVLRVAASRGAGERTVCPQGVAGITPESAGLVALTCQGDGSIHVVSLALVASSPGATSGVADLPAPAPGEVRQLVLRVAWGAALYAAVVPTGQGPRPTSVSTYFWSSAATPGPADDPWVDYGTGSWRRVTPGDDFLSTVYLTTANQPSVSLRPSGDLLVWRLYPWSDLSAAELEVGPGDLDASFTPTLVARAAP